MHHAYVVVGEQESILASLKNDIGPSGPDTFFGVYAQFGIDEAKLLKKDAYLRPVEREQRIFVIAFTGITHEAQNALLKLLEEPPETSRFYIVIPREDLLIATVRSRLHRLLHSADTKIVSPEAKIFLEEGIPMRFAEIAERMKEKDYIWGDAVLNGVEIYAEQKKDFNTLEAVAFVRKYYHTRGASKKMLLEHIALSLPVGT